MKKAKLMSIALVLALSFALSGLLVACNADTTTSAGPDILLDYDCLEAEEYRDYGEEIHLNTEDYPELERQGLRLVTGYGDNYSWANESKAESVDVIRNSFDPDKGILVIMNGLQLSIGRTQNANMQSDSRINELAMLENGEFEYDEIDYFNDDENSQQTYDLAKYWYDNGYNVFYFHWEMFADYYNGSLADAAASPDAVQERVWTEDTGVQAVYVRNGVTAMTQPNTAVNGCLAEWFAGEYIRMANAVNEVYPEYYDDASHDVRFAGHSMGGLLTVGVAALTHLLVDDGQLGAGFAPNRLALMDSYLGVSYNPDLTVAWSGKKYSKYTNISDTDCSCNYIAALRMLTEKYDVAAEFYCNEGYIVPFLNVKAILDLAVPQDDVLKFDAELGKYTDFNCDLANSILYYCPIVLIRPYFANMNSIAMTDGHNPIREWYLSSILYDAPTVVNPEDIEQFDWLHYAGYDYSVGTSSNLATVPTARATDEQIKQARGNFYVMRNDRTAHCETVRCDDDVFAINVNE